MPDETYSAGDLDDWERTIHALGRSFPSPSDERIASEEAANLCSEWGGERHMPEQIFNMVQGGVEAGYIAALKDVRDGRVDGLGPVDD